MNVLNQLKIRTRILILAVFPTLIVCGFALDKLNQAQVQQTKLQQLSVAMEFVKRTGSLLQAVQNERDYTYGFLSNSTGEIGSGGARYKKPLAEQREFVDAAVEQYKSYLSSVQHQLDTLEGIPNLSRRLVESLGNINYVRPYVDRYQLQNDKKEWVVNRYHTFNSRAIDAINGVIKLSISNEQLNLLVNAYASLMQINFVYSFERSNKLRTLSLGALDYTSHSNNKAAWRQLQDTITRFRAIAPANLINFYNQTHGDTPLQEKIYKMRQKLLSMGGKVYTDTTASEWFDDATENMKSLSRVITFAEQEITQATQFALDDSQSAVTNSYLLILFVVLTISIISFFIISSIINPLKKLVSKMSYVADNKDLSTSIPIIGKDELADVTNAFNSLQASFNDALKGILSEVKNMNNLTSSVNDSMGENQNRANSQTESTDSVSVAINEMSATIQEVANIAQSAAMAVSTAHDSSVESANNANTTKEIMEQLISELASAQKQVNQLNTETEVIGNILTVIQSIAEQTNLLALNAAIEAARAGEQGRGFAVVADEVRSLASRTQESTGQIRQQIEALQSGSRATTTSMENLQTQGSKAVTVVVSSVAAFESLRTELDNIHGMSSQIATAAEEQSAVAGEINERVHVIKDDTEEMKQHTTSTVDACQKLSQTSNILSEYVNQFKVAS